jgi:ribonuclease P protein component
MNPHRAWRSVRSFRPLAGLVVPKRHAKRAVTRNLIKRQARAAMARHLATLPAGLWVVRLRAPFDRAQFLSPASDALREATHAEMDTLFDRAIRQPLPADGGGGAPVRAPNRPRPEAAPAMPTRQRPLPALRLLPRRLLQAGVRGYRLLLSPGWATSAASSPPARVMRWRRWSATAPRPAATWPWCASRARPGAPAAATRCPSSGPACSGTCCPAPPCRWILRGRRPV